MSNVQVLHTRGYVLNFRSQKCVHSSLYKVLHVNYTVSVLLLFIRHALLYIHADDYIKLGLYTCMQMKTLPGVRESRAIKSPHKYMSTGNPHRIT